MNANAYMDDDTWRKLVTALCIGIRALPVVRDHPTWWFTLSADGFGSHFKFADVMDIFTKFLILFLKEEGDSSDTNQAYDKFVARDDKLQSKCLTGALRDAKHLTKGVVDQYHLLHVGLANLTKECEMKHWISSFKATNLHPDFRRSFADWCKEIQPQLEAGQTYKHEACETFDLLPAWWRVGMSAGDRRKCYELAVKYNFDYTTECVTSFITKCYIPLDDMQWLQVCLSCARKDEKIIDGPGGDAVLVAGIVADVETSTASVTNGLTTFMLHPPGLSPAEHFAHLCQKRKREGHNVECAAVGELIVSDKFSKDIVNSNLEELTVGQIMQEAGGEGATQKVVKRRLAQDGTVNSHCQWGNDPRRLEEMRIAARMAASIAEIKASKNTASDAEKEAVEIELLVSTLPAALDALRKCPNISGNTVTKLHLRSLVYRFCNGRILRPALGKQSMIEAFRTEVTKNFESMSSFLEQQQTPPPPAPVEAEVAAAPAPAAEDAVAPEQAMPPPPPPPPPPERAEPRVERPQRKRKACERLIEGNNS